MDSRFSASSLQSRTITALIISAVLAAVWLIGNWLLFAFVLAVACLTMWEFYSLFLQQEKSRYLKLIGCSLGGLLMLLVWIFPNSPSHLSLLCVALIVALISLISWKQETARNRLSNLALILTGIIYIPLVFAQTLHWLPVEQALVVLIPVGSDIAAYFTGISCGKHKIWPSVSPKKSIEGAIAGLLAAVVICCVIGWIWGAAHGLIYIVAGLFLGTLAQLGDFFESGLKRSVNVKDSGNLLPGHGGMLDRVDSILFCCAGYAILTGFHALFV